MNFDQTTFETAYPKNGHEASEAQVEEDTLKSPLETSTNSQFYTDESDVPSTLPWTKEPTNDQHYVNEYDDYDNDNIEEVSVPSKDDSIENEHNTYFNKKLENQDYTLIVDPSTLKKSSDVGVINGIPDREEDDFDTIGSIRDWKSAQFISDDQDNYIMSNKLLGMFNFYLAQIRKYHSILF